MSAVAPASAVPRRTRRKDARPEQITAAALELFVERGYAATRLEDVAARAGVAKGTVYLYFANKAELFKAVVREGLVSPLVEAQDLVDNYRGSMAELLRRLLYGWWERVGSTRLAGIPKLVIAEAGNFPEIARFYLDEVVEPGRRLIAQIVRRGIAQGEFRPVDPQLAGYLYFAPLLLLVLWQSVLAPHAPEMPDARSVLEAHLEMLRRGLASESAP